MGEVYLLLFQKKLLIMKNMKHFKTYLAAMALALSGCQSATDSCGTTELWYAQPAKVWMESLPIGNGRLGAMTYGGIEEEKLALNESTMWSGQYNENQNKPFGREKMNQLRKLFFEGKLSEGNRIAGDNLHGNQTSFGTHLPIGDLKMQFIYPEGKVTGYRRSLSLDEAVSSVSFNSGGVNYKREYFATNPDNVLVLRLTADKQKSITMNMGLDLMRQADLSVEDNQLVFTGKVDFPLHGPGGVCFEGRIAVLADNGEVKMEQSGVGIKEADAVTLIVDVRTDYKSPDYKTLCADGVKKAAAKSYDELKQAHIKDYNTLYNRVSIHFGQDANRALPTDVRWKQVKEGKTDTGLDALFFQYGRYLTIASSRENSPLPIALQGFFNDNKACNMGWTNDYHLDINTEQNYWAANVGNLAECNAPLFTYIKDLAHHGAKTAEVVYGCKGWTAHTTANVWGYTPASSTIIWGLFPMAGSWIASHLWTQYEFTQDKQYLAETAYPLLKGNAQFILDFLAKDPKSGYLMTGPSISPENWFRTAGGEEMVASMMPACDRELAYEILSNCVQASEILNTDREFADSLRTAIAQLPPIQLRANGAIREWFEDFEEAHPNHRHTSHLLALYPFSQITLEKTPELAEAARKTIENRLSAENWEDTEWSRANMICMYARLKDAQEAYKSVQLLQGKLSRENLMTVSPGGIAGAEGDIYSFDGNPAGTAGMAEMLVQNHEGYVEFLPCLPVEWKDGSFKGLCLKGGAGRMLSLIKLL
jgi:alpha-L-fucosidase 2